MLLYKQITSLKSDYLKKEMNKLLKEDIPQGKNFGMTHVEISDTLVRTPLGGFINHSDEPNCEKIKLRYTNEDKQPVYYFNIWNLITIKDIKEGEELTLKYTFYKM